VATRTGKRSRIPSVEEPVKVKPAANAAAAGKKKKGKAGRKAKAAAAAPAPVVEKPEKARALKEVEESAGEGKSDGDEDTATSAPAVVAPEVAAKFFKAMKEDLRGRGAPISGRWWKSVEKKRHTGQKKKTKSAMARYNKRKTDQQCIKDAAELTRNMKTAADERKKAERMRRKKKDEQNQVNERRGELVQMITNTAKLKKLNRKQLRQFEKR